MAKLAWAAFFIVAIWWLTQFTLAYQEALGHYYAVKNSQVARILEGGK
jgi:hypothetical protein